LESREATATDLRQLIDDVYEVPHHAVDQVKRSLLNIDGKEREEKTLVVLETMRDIGEEAQNKRPDSLRLRGARIATTADAPSLPELDARCKWLVGTLHLVVRKMQDSKETVPNMRLTLDHILAKCRRLPELVLQDFTPPSIPLLAELEKLVEIPDHPNLEQKIKKLAADAQEKMATKEIEKKILLIIELFKKVPETDKNTVRREVLTCSSLAEAIDQIERAHEAFKMKLLELENSEDEMGIEEFAQNLNKSGGLADRKDPVDQTKWRICQNLQPGYKCMWKELEAALEKDRDINKVDPSETLKRLEAVEQIVLGKMPTAVSFLRDFAKLQPHEIEDKLREGLTPNSGLQEFCDKLIEMTKSLPDYRFARPSS